MIFRSFGKKYYFLDSTRRKCSSQAGGFWGTLIQPCNEACYKIMLPIEGGKHFFKKVQENRNDVGKKISFGNGDGSMICNMYDFASLVGPKVTRKALCAPDPHFCDGF